MRRAALAVFLLFATLSWAPMHATVKHKYRLYQVGLASWYGSEFAGKPTASGAIFDPNGLTAAHPTLPLGTKIRVTNLRNHRHVIVVINDRGPYVAGRILDVSQRAAKLLRFTGVQRVKIEIVS